ncbi:MAG TPA: ATP-binding protein, partial [Thermoanaerobaculia bacterium]|nr:ATP-binding protein [Thermoanaerobaculia bacterium]
MPFEPAGERRQLLPRPGRLQRTLAMMRRLGAAHEEELRRVAVQQAAVANFGQLALTGASPEFLFEQAAALVTTLLDVEVCRVVVAGAAVPGPGDLAIEIASPDDEEPWGFLHLPHVADRLAQTTGVDFLRSIAFILGHAIARRRTEAELRRIALQQSAIAELGKLMMTTIDDATIERACELVVRGLGADCSCYAELSPDGKMMHRRVGGMVWERHLPQSMPVSDETHVGLTVLLGEPVVVDDYATETRFRTASTATAAGIVSGVVVPVASATRTYGVLSAHAKTNRHFGPGEVDYLLSLANIIGDALAREEARAALVATTRSLQLVLESTMDGIYTMDVEGRCTMINAAAARMLGRTAEELVGANMHELMHAQGSGGAPTETDCPIDGVLRDRAPRTVIDATFWRSDGTSLAIDYSAAPIFDGDLAVGAVVAFTDTTERRKLELKLAQATRLSSLGRLAATIAHEFNNVLMGISPFVELIRRRPERAATSLDQIGVAIGRGKRITEEILRFTKPAELIQTVIAVEPWLESIRLETQSLLPARYRIDVAVADGLHVVADRNQLSQVIMNLILNARDAMESGGTVSILAHRDRPGTKFPFGLVDQPERFVHFTVRDTGCGMPPETLKHIFEPLFTTKTHGTGLGLAVAHQVVERHGGEIFVESGPDGSAFHLFIPFAERPEEPASPAPEPRSAN